MCINSIILICYKTHHCLCVCHLSLLVCQPMSQPTYSIHPVYCFCFFLHNNCVKIIQCTTSRAKSRPSVRTVVPNWKTYKLRTHSCWSLLKSTKAQPTGVRVNSTTCSVDRNLTMTTAVFPSTSTQQQKRVCLHAPFPWPNAANQWQICWVSSKRVTLGFGTGSISVRTKASAIVTKAAEERLATRERGTPVFHKKLYAPSLPETLTCGKWTGASSTGVGVLMYAPSLALLLAVWQPPCPNVLPGTTYGRLWSMLEGTTWRQTSPPPHWRPNTRSAYYKWNVHSHKHACCLPAFFCERRSPLMLFVAAMLVSANYVWRRTSDLFICSLTYRRLVAKQYGQSTLMGMAFI